MTSTAPIFSSQGYRMRCRVRLISSFHEKMHMIVSIFTSSFTVGTFSRCASGLVQTLSA